jgi:hypothetical protein
MSERISTHYEKHKSWHHNVASITRSVVPLEHLRVVADLALMQTDLIIVFTVVAEDWLREQES